MKENACFAYKNGKCNILRIEKCEGVGCGFYKTGEQLKQDRQEAYERIQSLSKTAINNINETYYSGKLGEQVTAPSL